MRIMILGAGELGEFLATTLSGDRHDIVVVDQDGDKLSRLKDRLDVMIIEGNAATIWTLKRAGIEKTDILIAATGDEAANILACQVGSHFGVKKRICRLHSMEFFSESDAYLPEKLGITKVIVPERECVQKIANVLDNKIILEKITFSNPNAVMTAIEILPSSPLAGLCIKDFPDAQLISSVRFSAIFRDRQHLIPHGDTIIVPGDKVYLAGARDNVNKMLEYTSPDDSSISKVVIAGASRIGRNLAYQLWELGYNVRVMEKDEEKGQLLLEDAGSGSGLLVLHGDPTEKEVMEEAGVSSCDAFVSALDDDENNILSCIIAKKLGARKVITITRKSEYINIVPAMDMIDCGFSYSLVAVNTILQHISTDMENMGINAILHLINAYLFEFKVAAGSELCNKRIADFSFPETALIAMLFRGNEVYAASGDFILRENDVVAMIATSESVREIQPLFARKGFFSL
ncbi:MAG: hypothetical protein A2X49_09010 [Lentisphaerae bacterium GWF2_52_8]|nr:MAG: hypothetical protein A2X49_09010 [Lentisphaerae bacterium GWF2_52_8]